MKILSFETVKVANPDDLRERGMRKYLHIAEQRAIVTSTRSNMYSWYNYVRTDKGSIELFALDLRGFYI